MTLDRPKSYCEMVSCLDKTNIHRIYHDTAYGFPIEDDNELFERFVLEINQAGLSWTTILSKQANFHNAFDKFDVKTVANYEEFDRQRLLNDAGIIRNRLKVDATIHNANVILQLQNEYGSFKNWLDQNHPKSKEDWMKLFKKTFKFTGGEIVNEFLLSTGYLRGAHVPSCSIYNKILQTNPKWND